jgi:hypothetical protein
MDANFAQAVAVYGPRVKLVVDRSTARPRCTSGTDWRTSCSYRGPRVAAERNPKSLTVFRPHQALCDARRTLRRPLSQPTAGSFLAITSQSYLMSNFRDPLHLALDQSLSHAIPPHWSGSLHPTYLGYPTQLRLLGTAALCYGASVEMSIYAVAANHVAGRTTRRSAFMIDNSTATRSAALQYPSKTASNSRNGP